VAGNISTKTADTKTTTEPAMGHAPTPPDEKLASLMAYRKARGLCFKCGGKWRPQHKCPASVPMHMIEEV